MGVSVELFAVGCLALFCAKSFGRAEGQGQQLCDFPAVSGEERGTEHSQGQGVGVVRAGPGGSCSAPGLGAALGLNCGCTDPAAAFLQENTTCKKPFRAQCRLWCAQTARHSSSALHTLGAVGISL